MGLGVLIHRIDRRVVDFMARNGILLIRLALAVVFIWFGALKVAGHSPVANLAENLVYLLPADLFIPILGLWEIAIGAGLLAGKLMRVTLGLLFVQLAGTFLILVLMPEIAFNAGNPLLLTVEGEFVIKNLVLIAAGIAVGGTIRKRDSIRENKQQKI